MKTVEMTVDLKPFHRGQHVPLEDEIADRLVANGDAINPRPFPPKEPSIADREIMRAPLPSEGKPPRRRYLTK